MLDLLPKLTKLDNDDVTAEERASKPQMMQQATELHLSAAAAQPSPHQPSAIASQALLGANPMLEQVHQPAELQAALAMSHQVLHFM